MSRQPKIAKAMNRMTIGILCAAIGVVVWGWIADGRIAEQQLKGESRINHSRTVPVAPGSGSQSEISKESKGLSDIWSRRLQSGFRAKSTQPIAELMMPAKVSVQNAMASTRSTRADIGLRLVGTVIEKGRSMAIAIDRLGKLDFCYEGNSIQLEPEGVRVESIDADFVRVSFQGKSSTWLMGQSLRFESDVGDETVVLPTDAAESIPLRTMPKLNIEEELDRINGDRPLVPQ